MNERYWGGAAPGVLSGNDKEIAYSPQRETFSCGRG
jgi:hypothetical protein